jgi:hypothetical protein
LYKYRLDLRIWWKGDSEKVYAKIFDKSMLQIVLGAFLHEELHFSLLSCGFYRVQTLDKVLVEFWAAFDVSLAQSAKPISLVVCRHGSRRTSMTSDALG